MRCGAGVRPDAGRWRRRRRRRLWWRWWQEQRWRRRRRRQQLWYLGRFCVVHAQNFCPIVSSRPPPLELEKARRPLPRVVRRATADAGTGHAGLDTAEAAPRITAEPHDGRTRRMLIAIDMADPRDAVAQAVDRPLSRALTVRHIPWTMFRRASRAAKMRSRVPTRTCMHAP